MKELPDKIEGNVSEINEESYLQLCRMYGILEMALKSWVENKGLMRDRKAKWKIASVRPAVSGKGTGRGRDKILDWLL